MQEYIMDKLEKVFVKIVTDNKAGLYREAYSYLLNKEDAEDAVGNTILKAYTHIKDLQNVKKMKSWIYSILINECKNIIRHNSRINQSTFSVDECVYKAPEDESDIYDFIIRLEPIYREIVLLYYYENFKVKEIAQMLHLSEGTIKSRLARARKQIKDFMDGENM